MKILIIDDEVDILENIKNILQPTNYDFKITNDPNEAINQIMNEKYDVLILDVKMYPIDGLTLLKKMREINNSVYVILITAYEEFSILETAINLHVYSFIKKPLDIKKLISTLREIENKILALKKRDEEFLIIKNDNKNLKKLLLGKNSTDKIKKFSSMEELNK